MQQHSLKFSDCMKLLERADKDGVVGDNEERDEVQQEAPGLH